MSSAVDRSPTRREGGRAWKAERRNCLRENARSATYKEPPSVSPEIRQGERRRDTSVTRVTSNVSFSPAGELLRRVEEPAYKAIAYKRTIPRTGVGLKDGRSHPKKSHAASEGKMSALRYRCTASIVCHTPKLMM